MSKRARAPSTPDSRRPVAKRARLSDDNAMRDVVRWAILRACGAMARHAARTATRLARTCRALYYGTPWRAWVVELDDSRTAQLTPETMAPWAPHLTRFVYRMPHYRDKDHTVVDAILSQCTRLTYLALLGHRQGSPTVYAKVLPLTLEVLHIGNRHYSPGDLWQGGTLPCSTPLACSEGKRRGCARHKSLQRIELSTHNLDRYQMAGDIGSWDLLQTSGRLMRDDPCPLPVPLLVCRPSERRHVGSRYADHAEDLLRAMGGSIRTWMGRTRAQTSRMARDLAPRLLGVWDTSMFRKAMRIFFVDGKGQYDKRKTPPETKHTVETTFTGRETVDELAEQLADLAARFCQSMRTSAAITGTCVWNGIDRNLVGHVVDNDCTLRLSYYTTV